MPKSLLTLAKTDTLSCCSDLFKTYSYGACGVGLAKLLRN